MPLTAPQRQHLERRLLEERARISQELDRFADEAASDDEQDRAGDLTKVPYHAADQGTDAMDAELGASNATRQSAELAQIADALQRLYTAPARFGVCDDTGDDIPFERLDVVPWAHTCAETTPAAGRRR